MSLCTVQQAKSMIATLPSGSGSSTGAIDGLVQMLVDGATQRIRTICDRQFTLTTYANAYDGTGTNGLPLAETPVVQILDVTVNNIPWVEGTDFIRTASGLRSLCRRWPIGVQNVAVTYTAGFDPIPADLVVVCARLTAISYLETTRLGQRTVTGAMGESVSFDLSSLPAQDKLVLAQYTRVGGVMRANL